MEIKILGTGCQKCQKLIENVNIAVSELGIQAKIEKVTEIEQIMALGVMMTPGLMINGTVVSTGRLMNVNDLKKMFEFYG